MNVSIELAVLVLTLHILDHAIFGCEQKHYLVYTSNKY
jgi:hypothetical protein